jgi:phosphate transporter
LNESSALLQKSQTTFIQELDAALANIIQFYAEKECQVNTEFDQILTLVPPPIIVVVHDTRSSSSSAHLPLPSSEEEEEELHSITNTSTIVHNQDNYQDSRLIELYISLCKLKSFVSLNETAFEKILKKYDRLLNSNLKTSYITNTVLNAYPFRSSTRQHLEDIIQQVELMYNTTKEEGEKRVSLDVLFRERIHCDRDIVWRERIGQERKNTNLHTKEIADKAKQLKTPLILALSITLFVYLLNCSLFEQVEQRRCFAVLVFSSVLWATEVNLITFLTMDSHTHIIN